MRIIRRRLPAVALLATLAGLTLAGAVVPVQAETVNCIDVASLAAAPPYPITVPGVYCLQSDVNFTSTSPGAAIFIDSNNVVLDLNGHKIGGGGDPTTAGIGVYVNNHGNVIV